MEFLCKNKDFIIVNKPAGIPSQPDTSGDKDAMTLASEMLKEQGERGELYLVHRLDRVVGGLLVFARNKKSAAELSSIVSGDGIGCLDQGANAGFCGADGCENTDDSQKYHDPEAQPEPVLKPIGQQQHGTGGE